MRLAFFPQLRESPVIFYRPFFLATVIICVLSLTVMADTTDELIAHAHRKGLDQSRYWHLLLHAPNEESEIDDPAFFLSASGKSDLSAELDVTIRRLNEDANRSDESVFCRFPARRAWLEQELGVSFGEGECRAYDTLLEKLDPQKVTLVFPSAHINSPASMFGHTFLRIDSSMESKLTSYAINYAAQTEETNGLLFAYRGLFGGYNGFYSMLPYYEKLKEYRDTESRDVWEYDLNLSRDEVMAMVRHIWELQRIYSRYFFFDENCSYHMLWLTEIARPSIRLRDHFFYYVIPPETVHAFEDENLVRAKHYRASKRTRLLAYEGVLDEEGGTSALRLSSGEMAPAHFQTPPQRVQQRRYALEAAAELVEYRYIEGKLSKDEYAARYHALLKERASLGTGESVEIAEKPNPDTAHHGGRIQIARAYYPDRSPLVVGVRPAFHDLAEDATGHLGGAQIEFLDTQVALGDERAYLEKLTLLSLSSISPVSRFFKPFSWRMKTGWDREADGGRLGFVTRIGAGAAVGNESLTAYVLSEPEIRIQSTTDAGMGVSLGGLIQWPARMHTQVEAGQTWYLNARERQRLEVSHLWQLNRSFALWGRYGLLDQNVREERWQVGINLYF